MRMLTGIADECRPPDRWSSTPNQSRMGGSRVSVLVVIALLLAAVFLFVLYFVIRKAVFHGILDAEAERAHYDKQVRDAGQPSPDAPTS
jgi:phosphotransferase system  glucose/maltose/N-acetylglucosamine-specific IIC component